MLTADKELSLLARNNKERFQPVAVEGSSAPVLLTPHGELPSGQFYDPATLSVLDVDHKALTASKSTDTLSAAQLTSIEAASAVRNAVDTGMQQYVQAHLPSGVVTTYGSTGAGVKVIACVAVNLAELNNYWAGAWRSEWHLEVPMGGSIGTLTGKVYVQVHYFEDGNVQLDDRAVFQCDIPAAADKVGAEFAEAVKKAEQGFLAKLEDIYSNMSEKVLQALRRRLPVTKTKFDWDKLAVARLAADLQSAAAVGK